MNESFPSPESTKITDGQATEALRDKDTNPDSRKIFERWLDQAQGEIDQVYNNEGPKASSVASIRWSLRRASVYYRAGFANIAIDDLAETCDAAGSKIFDGSGLYEETMALLESVKRGKNL